MTDAGVDTLVEMLAQVVTERDQLKADIDSFLATTGFASLKDAAAADDKLSNECMQLRAEVERLNGNLTAEEFNHCKDNEYLVSERDNLRVLVTELVDALEKCVDTLVYGKFVSDIEQLLARAKEVLEGKP